MTTSMDTDHGAWQIVPYLGKTPFKKVRVRDDGRIDQVVRHLQAHECVSLIGPPFSEKSRLLDDVAEVVLATGLYRPLYLDLWDTDADDEAAFFASLAWLIHNTLLEATQGGSRNGATPYLPVARRAALATRPPSNVTSPRAFQNYLTAAVDAQPYHLVLLIDHLQALPHDLVHSLLLALRAAYMETAIDAPRQLSAVVTGGMNLVGLSAGPTSPFNIAKPVLAIALSEEQSLALAEGTLAAHGLLASAGALARIVEWAAGDRYIVPQLCAWCAELVQGYRRRLVDRRVVDRAACRLFPASEARSPAPLREAIHTIEEDADSVLDVLHLLEHGRLARSRAHQMPTRTGADRLQLSGAILLDDGSYMLKNHAYRRALTQHFTTERVGHILRMAGRWQETIAYLAPQVKAARAYALPAGGGVPPVAAVASVASVATPPAPETTGVIDGTSARPVGLAPARRPAPFPNLRPGGGPDMVARSEAALSQLLEATVQSIYATDSLSGAWELLARGLEQGFGAPSVVIYRAEPAQARLDLVYPSSASAPREADPRPANTLPRQIDLRDPDSVEARTFAYGSYALRGSSSAARLVATLREATHGHRLGVIVVEHFVEERNPHELPGQLPELLHFLEHASGAIENVLVRAAYREIGEAVLDASTVQPSLQRVLEVAAGALGCDAAHLYLLDAGQALLEPAAGAGQLWNADWQVLHHLSANGDHPAAACLREGRMRVMRGSDERLARSAARPPRSPGSSGQASSIDPDLSPSGQAGAPHGGAGGYASTSASAGQLTWVFLPLHAVNRPLGTLELGYSGVFGNVPGQEGRANLAAFGNQVAIAVHNMQLLRRTDEALARRIVELERLRNSSLAISATLDVPTVLARIIRDLRALFPDSQATIWEYQTATGRFCVLQSSLADEEYLAAWLGSTSATAQAVASGQVQIIADLTGLPETAGHGPAARLGLRGLIAVPLVSHDRILGAINLYFAAAGAATARAPGVALALPGDGAAELLQAFAAHAAVAIDNARLHEEEIKRQRLEQELRVAQAIQQSLLPVGSPEVPGWQFAAAYRSARVVGGDFYDFCELSGDPRRIGVVVADVTDKGVPAAIFMALSRTIIRTMAMSGRGPAAALRRANDLILSDSPTNICLTAVYAVVDVNVGRVIFANGGHNRPLLCRAADNSVSELRARGILLGAFENIELEEQRVDVAPGDALLLYTDGITDALNAQDEVFGEARLQSVFRQASAGGAQEILQAILDAVAEFVGDQEQADDITCVVVKRAAPATEREGQTGDPPGP